MPIGRGKMDRPQRLRAMERDATILTVITSVFMFAILVIYRPSWTTWGAIWCVAWVLGCVLIVHRDDQRRKND